MQDAQINTFNIMGHMLKEPWVTLIGLAAIIVLGMIMLTIVVFIVRRLLRRSSRLDDMLNAFIVNLVRTAGVILIISACLDRLGVSMGTIVAVLGAAGAAIALALKDSLANIAGGIMIIVTQPFKRGDLIRINEFRGRVRDIDLFLTTLRTLNYEIITIPNGLVNTSVLVNESREERRRVDLEFAISYDADIQKAKKVMLEVCEKGELILEDPAPVLGIRRQDDSAVVFELFAWCETKDFFNAGYYLQEEVKKAFDENGIEIPFPQVDVHIREKDKL